MNKFIGVFCLICCCRELEEVKFNVKEILGFFCLQIGLIFVIVFLRLVVVEIVKLILEVVS